MISNLIFLTLHNIVRIYTKDEAESVTKHYSKEILIGKPIMPPGI
jgi:hypothetical protein